MSFKYNTGTLFYCEEVNSPCNQVCIVEISASFLPYDLIDFLQPFHPRITSIDIFKHTSNDLFISLITLIDTEAANDLYNDFNGQPFSSLSEDICILYKVSSIQYNISTSQSSTISDTNAIEFYYRNVKNSVESIESIDLKRNPSTTSNINLLEHGSLCPVCLDNISQINPCSFSMFCGHTFHISCVAQLESPQCPVCRYDTSASLLTQCSRCAIEGATAASPTDIQGIHIPYTIL